MGESVLLCKFGIWRAGWEGEAMKYYKVFADDLSAPIQGGSPVWDGKLPFRLPVVNLDRSANKCGKLGGWHFVKALDIGLAIVGLWPRHGLPSRAFELTCDTEVIEREEKCRASTAIITRELEEEEINKAIHVMSNKLMSPNGKEMTELQIAWRKALCRPFHDEKKVHEVLSECWNGWIPVKITAAVARNARDMWTGWDARDAWTARDARDTWDAWAGWNVWAAWTARNARDTWAGWDARDAWTARDARDAWAAQGAWAGWDAQDACTERFVVLNDWSKPTGIDRDKLREAYQNGALTVIPMNGNKLGYVMQLQK
jgi:hypothetical protein